VIALDDADPETLNELVSDRTKVKKVKDKKKLPKLHEEISTLIEDDLIKSTFVFFTLLLDFLLTLSVSFISPYVLCVTFNN
jgi:hypothetical protein